MSIFSLKVNTQFPFLFKFDFLFLKFMVDSVKPIKHECRSFKKIFNIVRVFFNFIDLSIVSRINLRYIFLVICILRTKKGDNFYYLKIFNLPTFVRLFMIRCNKGMNYLVQLVHRPCFTYYQYLKLPI